MRFATLSAFTCLTVLAHAGQQFSFPDPLSSPSYSNYMFETKNLLPPLFGIDPPGTASIQNFYSGTVPLTVDNFSVTGAYLSSQTVLAQYYLSNSSSNMSNDVFGGAINPVGSYATGGGRMIFATPGSDPNVAANILLRVSFAASTLAYSPLASAPLLTFENLSATPSGIGFSGGLFNTTETSNPRAGFGLQDRFVSPNDPTLAHHSSKFYASIGTIGALPTPEPTPMIALSVGAFALLRRRRQR